MTTIKKVAKEAGVSVATVSRAINNSGYVKAETQKKIDKAIEKLNYSPNETARTLFRQKSKLIGLLLPDMSNPFFTVVARGVEDEAMERGYHIIIGNGDSDVDKEDTYLNTFKVHNCSGIVASQLASEENFEKFKSYDLPFVLLDRVFKDHEYVEANHYKGGRLQAEVIIKGKAQSVLILKQNEFYKSFSERIRGAKEVLNRSNKSYIEMDERDLTDKALIHKIKKHRIDSIICSNDVSAIKVLSMLNQYNIQVPKEIQVVGYDDIPLAQDYIPSLTTVQQPAYLIGKQACQLLIDQLENKKRNQHQKLDVHLIERQTTRSVSHEKNNSNW